MEGSPAVPVEAGIALSLPRVLTLDGDTRCVLRASFRLPIRAVDRPRQGERPDQGKPMTAIVPVWLLVVGADDGGAGVIPLRVPSYAPLEGGLEQPLAVGHFALDLLRTRGMPDAPQTYFIYAFSGPVLAGPVPTAFVTPEMIR